MMRTDDSRRCRWPECQCYERAPQECRVAAAIDLKAALAVEDARPQAVEGLEPVDFQWKVCGRWISADPRGTVEERRNYAQAMANSIGEGYRELYSADQLAARPQAVEGLEPVGWYDPSDEGDVDGFLTIRVSGPDGNDQHPLYSADQLATEREAREKAVEGMEPVAWRWRERGEWLYWVKAPNGLLNLQALYSADQLATEREAREKAERERDEAINPSDRVCNGYAAENQGLFDRAAMAESALAQAQAEIEQLNREMTALLQSAAKNGDEPDLLISEWREAMERAGRAEEAAIIAIDQIKEKDAEIARLRGAIALFINQSGTLDLDRYQYRAFCDLREALKGSPMTYELPTHRHKKRGTEYVLLGYGRIQVDHWLVDMREVAIYRSIEDGKLWVRPKEEFEDGRFERLTEGAK